MKSLIPDYEFDDVTKIDLGIFEGMELIIFDVDNTLVYAETANIRKDIMDWFQRINKKYKCVCVSNSRTITKRKDEIVKKLECELYISQSKKPSKQLFREIVKKYNADPKKIIVIGDFRFTDVLFGNRSGAKTILVKPFGSDSSKKVKILRKLENIIIKILK